MKLKTLKDLEKKYPINLEPIRQEAIKHIQSLKLQGTVAIPIISYLKYLFDLTDKEVLSNGRQD